MQLSGKVFLNNTEIAMEMAGEAGMPVASVLSRDDVSLAQSANRRGMGAAVLVEKIAGAAAEAGRSLAEVASVARRASERTRSMGVALSGCTSLAAGRPSFQLPAGEIEVGVGIHGEPGRQRSRWVTADEVVDLLAAPILQELALKSGDRVLVMVSGLGGTPSHELYIVFRRLHQVLDRLGVVVERQLIGSYITSLDMAGCTVTILPLDAELLALWDAPVHTPALHW